MFCNIIIKVYFVTVQALYNVCIEFVLILFRIKSAIQRSSWIADRSQIENSWDAGVV